MSILSTFFACAEDIVFLIFLILFNYGNDINTSLILHQVKIKEIITVKEVWQYPVLVRF